MRLLLYFFLLFHVFGDFVNERVVRVIDLQSQVEKQIVKAEISNPGTTSSRIYHFPIPKAKRDKLAFFKAVDTDSEELAVKLVSKIDGLDSEESEIYFFMEIKLLQPIPANSDTKVQLTITLVYIHVLQMLPAKIKQKENQYVVYEGNRYCDSIYPTRKQHTKINVASETIKSHTKDGHEQLTGKKIKYGTYEDIEPLGYKQVRVHFRNNNAFLTFTDVVRDMEVSHWGNVRVTEMYNIRHDGAKLTGPYESEDANNAYYGGRLAEPSAVRELKATLPGGASRVTYLDRIGNISTSHFRQGRKKSILELEMRYKLLGGWKTDFTISYDVPASGLVSVKKSDPSLHYFDASFGMPFTKPVANFVKTSVALPEGAYDIKVHLPFEVDEQDFDVRYTYLDSQIGGGRPVVYFVKSNVVREHFENFQISYRYSAMRIYYKPVMVTVLLFLGFMFVSLMGRVEINLTDGSRGRVIVQAAVETVLALSPGNSTEKRLCIEVQKLLDGMDCMEDEDVTEHQKKMSRSLRNKLKGQSKKKKSNWQETLLKEAQKLAEEMNMKEKAD